MSILGQLLRGGKINNDAQMSEAEQQIRKMSKFLRTICKNDKCGKLRRDGSAYCQNCSDKHNNL